MTIAISQPTYLPWLGYFELIAQADIFVFLDSVQFQRQSWQSRNRLRTKEGNCVWLTVPTSKARLQTPISMIEVAPRPSGWWRNHLKTIEGCLGGAPAYCELVSEIGANERMEHERLSDLNIDLITRISRSLGLATRFERSSMIPVNGRREELLLNICEFFGVDRYYSNSGSADYLESWRPTFEDSGIDLVYQRWGHPVYHQVGEGFISHLSVVDAIACVGFEKAAQFLTS